MNTCVTVTEDFEKNVQDPKKASLRNKYSVKDHDNPVMFCNLSSVN